MPPAETSKRSLGSGAPSTASKKRRVANTQDVSKAPTISLSQNAPMSSFEEELGNLTQEINHLRATGSERDQNWPRPDLDPAWNPETDSLLFQQIDIEEGTLNGMTAIRLFGVTGVITPAPFSLGLNC